MRIISNLFILFSKYLEVKRINPWLKVGHWFLVSGIPLLGTGIMVRLILNTTSIDGNVIALGVEITENGGYVATIIGAILTILGVLLCLKGLVNTHNDSKKKTFYYLKGLSNQSENPPFNALPKLAKWYPLNKVKLSLNTEEPVGMIEKLVFHLEMISDKVEQIESDEIYFAGLARVPYLFFVGYGFKNAHSSSITLLDHNHKMGKWFTLKDTDEIDIDLDIKNENEIKPTANGNIGVAIEFTCKIPENEFPETLRGHIVRVCLNKIVSHNQITSQITLERIVDDTVQLLIRLNKKVDAIHLFISAQSTLVFSLGRRYQDGMMGTILIYNYNAEKKKYPWAFKIENKEIKLIEEI